MALGLKDGRESRFVLVQHHYGFGPDHVVYVALAFHLKLTGNQHVVFDGRHGLVQRPGWPNWRYSERTAVAQLKIRLADVS